MPGIGSYASGLAKRALSTRAGDAALTGAAYTAATGIVGNRLLTSAVGRTGAGAIYGAAAGGAYGVMADDTSMIGGALMGAGMGAGAGRYGRGALRTYGAARAGKMWGPTLGRSGAQTASPLGRPGAMGMAARNIGRGIKRDVHTIGSTLFSNSPMGRVSSTLKGWGANTRAGFRAGGF